MAFLTDISKTLQDLFNSGASNVGKAIQNFNQPMPVTKSKPLFNTSLANNKPINYGQVMQNIPNIPLPYTSGQLTMNNLKPNVIRVGQQLQKINFNPAPKPLNVPTNNPVQKGLVDFYNFTNDMGLRSPVAAQVAQLMNPLPSVGRLMEKGAKGTLGKGGTWDKVGDATDALSVFPVGKVLSKGDDVAKAAFYLRSKLKPEDANILKEFATFVEINGPKKAMPGNAAITTQAIMKDAFGVDAQNWSNQKMKNVVDLVLGKIGNMKNSAGLGLGLNDIRGGVKVGNTGIRPTKQVELPASVQQYITPSGKIVPQVKTATSQLADSVRISGEAAATQQASAGLAQEARGAFSKDQIKLINDLKSVTRSRAFLEGDIETLRRSGKGDVVERGLQAIREVRPDIVNEADALEFARNLPTKGEMVVKKLRLTPEEQALRTRAISEQSAFEKEFGREATTKEQLRLQKEWDSSFMDQFKGQPYGATPKTIKGLKIRDAKAEAQMARKNYDEWSRAVFSTEASRSTTGAIKDIATSIKSNTLSPAVKNIEGYRDISGFNGQARDVYRNFKQVFGNKIDVVKKTILDPFDASKGKFTKALEAHADDLDTNIVKKYGIEKGSKESAAVQLYGEGSKTFPQLVEEFGEKKANDIVAADKWFRSKYDSLLSEVNAVRARIYPNNPEKIIPRRDDYYRHFKEIEEGFRGLANIFDSPSNIQSGLAGVSATTKPKSKWLSFAQKRLGMESDIDAVGGFINYIKSAEYAKNIDPHISVFRALREELAQATDLGTPHAGKLNNFIEFLDSYANDLSGKTSPADRFIQTIIPGGRKTMSVLNWVNNRVKANVILGNASSSLAQIMNVPQGIASAGPVASTKGLGRTISSIFDADKVINKSDFISERYSGGVFNRFDKGMIDKGREMAAWMVGVLDNVGTKYIWNSHYEKALSEGIENPIKYADDFTRQMVAGRGIGEVPLLQKSKVFQLVAPFQLEVGNLWHVLGGFVDEKQFGKIATFMLASYVFNRGVQGIRGSDVSFDPIQASIEAYQAFAEEENKGIGAMRAGGRLSGEVLSNIPFGQSVAVAYPEYGIKVGETQLPTREDFFGKGDPTRFGSGLLAMKGLQDPLFKIAPPYAGQQIKRSIDGISAVNKGYSESASGKIQYPIAQNTMNTVRAGLFGQSSTPEAQQYFNEDRSPLGDKQSEAFKKSSNPMNFYNSIINKRAKENEVDKIKKSGGGTVDDTLVTNDGKTINLTSPTKGNGIDAFTNENWNYTKAREVWKAKDSLTPQQLSDTFKKLGVTQDDVRYDYLATRSTDIKTQYIVSKNYEHDALLERLLTGRVVSATGTQFASNGVIDNLYEQGLLSKEERAALKKIKTDKTGKSTVKASGQKKGKKLSLSIAKSSSSIKPFNLKLSKPKAPKVKIGKSKTLTLTKAKQAKPAKFKASGIKVKMSRKPSLA